MTRKSFTTVERVLEFDIDGEAFRTIPAVPAGLMLDLSGAGAAAATNGFLAAVLDPESCTRFEARLRDKDRPIDGPTLKAVIDWLSEELADRPFELPSGSPGGPVPTGTSSTDGASSAG